jgi:hypothetical protein
VMFFLQNIDISNQIKVTRNMNALYMCETSLEEWGILPRTVSFCHFVTRGLRFNKEGVEYFEVGLLHNWLPFLYRMLSHIVSIGDGHIDIPVRMDVPQFAYRERSLKAWYLDRILIKLSLCFNWAPRHEEVLGSGGIAPLILWPRH